jgi:hypothetical protein
MQGLILSYRRNRPIQQPTASSSYSCATTPLYIFALAAVLETHMRRLRSEGGVPTLGPAWTTFSSRLPSTTAFSAAQWTLAAKNLTTTPYKPAFSSCRSPEVRPPPDPTMAPAFPAYSGSPAAKQPMPPLCKQTHIRSFNHAPPPSPLEILLQLFNTFIVDFKQPPTRVDYLDGAATLVLQRSITSPSTMQNAKPSSATYAASFRHTQAVRQQRSQKNSTTAWFAGKREHIKSSSYTMSFRSSAAIPAHFGSN